MPNECSFNPFPSQMIVRYTFVSVLVVAALMLCAGCSGNGNTVTADETTDPVYQQAQELSRQGRNGEALSAYLKVIDRRGEAGAPESHLEAGNLYLNWAKDPFEAYHHFGKYLESHPNGPRSDMVRGQREAAKREAAKILNAPMGDQGLQLQQNEEIDTLRHRVQELTAEVQTLRGGGSAGPVMRAPPVIAVPEDRQPGESADVPVASVEPSTSGESSFVRPFSSAPANNTSANTGRPAPAPSTSNRTSAVASRPVTAPERTAVTPTRPGTLQRPTAPAAAGGGRRHTVSPTDKSLWGIARRYYGSNPTAAQVQAIYEANRDVMRSNGDLRAGMVLRIP